MITIYTTLDILTNDPPKQPYCTNEPFPRAWSQLQATCVVATLDGCKEGDIVYIIELYSKVNFN